jgi:hypothetical protein
MRNDEPGLGMRLRYETMRISSQHEKLNELYADLRRELDQGNQAGALVDCGRLRDALEAHFEVEDCVYFPAVHGFRPDQGPLLRRLASDHVAFRAALEDLQATLESHDLDAGASQLHRLVTGLVAHEKKEEVLLAEVNQSTKAKGPFIVRGTIGRKPVSGSS